MYKITVMNDEEFEKLPYPDMPTSLGVADPSTNEAYVRYTGVNELDKHLINHELEHLIEGHGGKHSDHYRNGVYYKGFGEVLQTVLPTIGGFLTGGPVGAGIGAAGTIAQKKLSPKPQQQPQQSFSQPQPQAPQQSQSPLEGFSTPSTPSITSSSPNIITPGGMSGQVQDSGATGGSSIDKLRGFFTNRSPQQEFN